MTTNPLPPSVAALALAKLIAGQSLNGYTGRLLDPWATVARAVEACPPSRDQRVRALDAALAGMDNAAAIRAAIFAADPGGDLESMLAQAEQAQEIAGELLESGGDSEVLQLTDMGNGRRFAMQHKGKVCFVESWGWMVWNGKKWEQDETGKVWRLARKTVKTIYHEAESALDKAKAAIRALEAAQEKNDESAIKAAIEAKDRAEKQSNILLGWALKSQGAARVEAMLKFGRSEPELVARTGDFDNNPWLLNVQNGILDLKTGKLKPHDPAERLTKIAGAAYDPGATCPTWEAFLSRVFDYQTEVIDFLQRAAGYSLTGDVGEQCLFFLYGTGANGKSTFTGALQDVLGDYAMKTRAETLMIKKQDVIPEEVAQLAGVRFMLAAELGEGQRLNESLIKDLTGGDKIRGRLLYQKSFEYSPVAKPWLYGNHKPIIKGTDEGIWRRPKLIPFLVTIPPEERDRDLPAKLRAELAGVLSWCVRGCMAWLQNGLQTPQAVTVATDEFRNEQDILGAFTADCCMLHPLVSCTAGVLYAGYKAWAVTAGLEPMSQVAFSRQMTERGYKSTSRQPGSGLACLNGIRLLTPEEQANRVKPVINL